MAILTDFFDPKSTENQEKTGFCVLVFKITVATAGFLLIIIVLDETYHNIYSSML